MPRAVNEILSRIAAPEAAMVYHRAARFGGLP
jgi:hypothetical protein